MVFPISLHDDPLRVMRECAAELRSDLVADRIAVSADGGADPCNNIRGSCPELLCHACKRLCPDPLHRPTPAGVNERNGMMHRVIEEDGHAVRIAEEERDIVVIRDQRICIGDTVCIVPRTAARIAAKNAYDLRPMHLSRCADPLCRKPQRCAVPPAVLPHSRGVILHVQCHVQRIIRGSTDAALPCREPMHERVARKEIQPPAPQIVAEMP